MEHLCGYIDHILFQSAETGFTVARLKTPKQLDLINIVGFISEINPGQTIHCEGNWKHHSKHGRQFEIQQYELSAPVDVLGIQKYLESGMVKGVGPVYAKKIVEAFGIKTLEIIDKNPEKLSEIPGVGAKRIEKIKQYWGEQKSVRSVMIFLQSHKVRPSFAQKIFKKYGDESIEKVTENPYRLAKEIYGVGFKTADELAQNLGISFESPLRIRAGVEHVLWELSTNGHVCYKKNLLAPEAAKMLEISEVLINKEIKYLIQEELIIEDEIDSEPYIWVKPLYLTEIGLAREFKRINDSSCIIRSIITEKAIDWAQEKQHIRFAKEQKIAILQSLTEKIHIITGGPGTGKSTITRAILSISSRVTEKIILAAPTGRAAKRMSDICYKKAFTIHSLWNMIFLKADLKEIKIIL